MIHLFVALGELVDVVSGFAFKSEQFNTLKHGLPLVRIRDVIDGKSDTYYSGDYKAEFLVENGDALIGMDGQFNLACWRGGKALLNQRVCKVKAIDRRLDQRFLLHFLPSALKDIEDRTPFVTVKHLSVKALREIKVPLFPLPEQRRIAAILDKADELRIKRREAIVKLDQLLQSVFLEMFGDPVTNPKGWQMVKAGEIFSSFIGGKNIECPDESASPYRILKVSAVTSKVYRPEESKPAPEGFTPAPNAIVEKGDLLFSRANTTELVAATAFVWDTPKNIVLPDKLWKMRISDSAPVRSLFLWELFKTSSFRNELSKRSSGTSGSMKNIAKSKLTLVPVPLPPIELQDHFAKLSERIHSQLGSIQKAHMESVALFASLQRQAFIGAFTK